MQKLLPSGAGGVERSTASSRQPAPGRAGDAARAGMLQGWGCCRSGNIADLGMMHVWKCFRSGDAAGLGILVVQGQW